MRWLVVAFLAWGGMSWAAPKPTIAIYPIVSEGIPAKDVLRVKKAIHAELENLEYLNVVTSAKGSGKCQRGQFACLAGRGKSVNAQEIFYYSLKKLKNGYLVSVVLVDSSERSKAIKLTEKVRNDFEDLILVARGKVLQLKAKEKYVGQLVLSATRTGKLWIDSKEVKDGEPFVLPVGTYKIERKVKGKSGSKKVKVEFNKTVLVSFKDNKTTPLVSYSTWNRAVSSNSIALPPPPPLEESNESIPLPEIVNLVDGEKTSPQTESTATNSTYFLPKWPGYAGAAIGATLLLGGVVQELRAVSFRNEAREKITSGGNVRYSDFDVAREKSSNFRSARNSGLVLLGLGTAMVAGSGAYLFWFVPSASGAQAGISGQF